MSLTKNEKKDYNNYCQRRYIELLIFKLVFCDEWCFNVALCLAAGWFIIWAWRWGRERAGEFATLRTLCFLHWLDFLVSFKLNFYKQIGFCLSCLSHNAQLSVESFQYSLGWVFIISEKTGAKTPPCFIGCKHLSIRLNILILQLSFLVLLYDCERYFSQYSRCLIQTVSFFYQKDSKLRQILGSSHLLFNSKRDQCRGMFCVSLLASHLVAYTWEESQPVRKLGLLSHFDCYEIGARWRIFWLVSPRAHENWNHGPKIS